MSDSHKPIFDGLDPFQVVGHISSLLAVFGTIMQLIPAAAGLAAFAWYAISIYESKTVQLWLAKHRERRHEKRQRKLHRPH